MASAEGSCPVAVLAGWAEAALQGATCSKGLETGSAPTRMYSVYHVVVVQVQCVLIWKQGQCGAPSLLSLASPLVWPEHQNLLSGDTSVKWEMHLQRK